jgi:hypothetical protein
MSRHEPQKRIQLRYLAAAAALALAAAVAATALSASGAASETGSYLAIHGIGLPGNAPLYVEGSLPHHR